jgi:hypothetical protein
MSDDLVSFTVRVTPERAEEIRRYRADRSAALRTPISLNAALDYAIEVGIKEITRRRRSSGNAA